MVLVLVAGAGVDVGLVFIPMFKYNVRFFNATYEKTIYAMFMNLRFR